MKVYENMVGVNPIATGKPQTNERQSRNGQTLQTGFEQLFAGASQRMIDNLPIAGGQNENSRCNRQEEVSFSRNERQSRQENIRDENPSNVNEANVSSQTESSSINDNEPVIQYEPKIDEENAVAAVAAILQIPVDEVIELLEEMNLDVEALLDSNAVSKLLQNKLGTEDKASLLTDSDFAEQFKALNETMAGLKIEAEVSQVIASQTSDAQAKVGESSGLMYAEVDGLEILNEDGQLVVTNESDEEVYADTTRVTSIDGATASLIDSQTSNALLTGEQEGLLINDALVVEENQVFNPQQNIQVEEVKTVQQTRQTEQTPVRATDIIEQIMSQVKVTQAGGNFTEMRMTLRPETLGDVVLRVLTQNGIVVAQFEAESQRVKELLESNFNMLRGSLEEQGIRFSELSVYVRQDENERMRQFEQGRKSAQRLADELNSEEEQEEVKVVNTHSGVIDLTA